MPEVLEEENRLVANLRQRRSELATLLSQVNSDQVYEDLVYRFYHQSFKVYAIQAHTRRIADALRSLAPSGTQLSPMFEQLVALGASGKSFAPDHNEEWTAHTRPFLEAFFHAKYFLEMAVKYGEGLHPPPNPIPSGWAALLSLYNLR